MKTKREAIIVIIFSLVIYILGFVLYVYSEEHIWMGVTGASIGSIGASIVYLYKNRRVS